VFLAVKRTKFVVVTNYSGGISRFFLLDKDGNWDKVFKSYFNKGLNPNRQEKNRAHTRGGFHPTEKILFRNRFRWRYNSAKFRLMKTLTF
jgi:6-phosphogluconolactonase (cycloisomerase 2 family)